MTHACNKSKHPATRNSSDRREGCRVEPTRASVTTDSNAQARGRSITNREPPPGRSIDADIRAAMAGHDAAGDREAEAEAGAAGAIGAMGRLTRECFEDRLALIDGDAGAAIGDDDPGRGEVSRSISTVSPRRRVIDRVAQQVVDDDRDRLAVDLADHRRGRRSRSTRSRRARSRSPGRDRRPPGGRAHADRDAGVLEAGGPGARKLE